MSGSLGDDGGRGSRGSVGVVLAETRPSSPSSCLRPDRQSLTCRTESSDRPVVPVSRPGATTPSLPNPSHLCGSELNPPPPTSIPSFLLLNSNTGPSRCSLCPHTRKVPLPPSTPVFYRPVPFPGERNVGPVSLALTRQGCGTSGNGTGTTTGTTRVSLGFQIRRWSRTTGVGPCPYGRGDGVRGRDCPRRRALYSLCPSDPGTP